jgi:Holliday junction resolvase
VSYVNGRAFEYRVKHYLEAQGYFVVRSAGSKGVADLVAFKFGETLFVQVKGNDSPLSPGEWNGLISLTRRLGGTPIHAFRSKRKIVLNKILSHRLPRQAGLYVKFDPDCLENESCSNPA